MRHLDFNSKRLPHTPSNMLRVLVATIALCSAIAMAGSPCPPRKLIYPCTCANIKHGKSRTTTVVTCTGLDTDQTLEEIFPFLKSLDINQFYLYDSFWKNDLQAGGSLPEDWLTMLKSGEMEIVDTRLSSCFACKWRLNCRNGITSKFSLVNSTSSDKLCNLCDTGKGTTKLPWTTCLTNLKEFRINYGKLTSFGLDVFPTSMRELVSVNLAYNMIVKIDPNALKNLPNLKSLDLSHNAIEHFDHLFTSDASGNLEYLDLGFNFIKVMDIKFFRFLTNLKTLKMNNNQIVGLNETVWRGIPDKLRTIDLTDNPLHCDCAIRWINGTFSTTVHLSGTCGSPEEFRDTPIRRASRYAIERCDESGRLGERKKEIRRDPAREQAAIATGIRRRSRPGGV